MLTERPLPSQHELQVALCPAVLSGYSCQRAAAQVKCRDIAALIYFRSVLFLAVHDAEAGRPSAMCNSDYFLFSGRPTFLVDNQIFAGLHVPPIGFAGTANLARSAILLCRLRNIVLG